ncbi:MAG TPA: 50S ribosomal protein L15 [Planctomycetes bacterium]|jgi:large subunit ribosomal protein L15|nr:50S ribosomal protein L15 [Planctomycetota bacterium]
MQIHDVTARGNSHDKRKRVGRGVGSGKGKTAGKGHNGQRSRSGDLPRLGFEGGQMPLFRRMPKRGFTNARFKKHYTLVNIESLDAFDAGEVIDLKTILDKGLARKTGDMLKVLGQGDLSKELTIKAHKFSKSALAKIEAAGGTAELID